MLTARSVVITVIAVAVLSIIGTCLSLLRSPGSSGLGGDTYGTRAHGQQAVFEVLSELNIPVERQLLPPTAALDRQVTLVFWAPNHNLVQLEPAYLQKVSEWVRSGGRVVVAPVVQTTETYRRPGSGKEEPIKTILEALGLEDVSVGPVNSDGSFEPPPSERSTEEILYEDVPRVLEESWNVEEIPTRSVNVEVTGQLSNLSGLVTSLEVSEYDLQVIDSGETKPTGTLTFKTDDGIEQTLVATYQLGKGQIVVVGDPSLAQNSSVAEHDNSVLAVHLTAAAGLPVVFDEFYHGLIIRGNPLWLFTRRTYGVIALVLLAVIGLSVWQQAVFLGPPLESVTASRRTIAEYIDAASRLINHGRSSGRFLISEMRSGVLWKLRHDLALPHGEEQPEQIIAAIHKRDPERAKQLADALELVDATLADNERLTEKTTILALQRISACL